MTGEFPEQRFSNIGGLGKERPDLVAVETGADHAIAVDVATFADHQPDMSIGAQPALQEPSPRGRKACPVVIRERVRIGRFDGNDPCIPHPVFGKDPAEANVPVGQDEPGFAVIVLLIGHPVEPDGLCPGGRQNVLPECGSDPMAAQIRAGDVETQKGKLRCLGYQRHARGNIAIEPGDPEPVRVGSLETSCVLAARVLALPGGPCDHGLDIFGVCDGECQAVRHRLPTPVQGDRVQFTYKS